ncbi:MAG: hypothetical protein K0R46_1588 [Herbinix sp.]|jgi:hypothetical protein|nr:hypothetical protein [Herbinix sp.]
MVMRQEKAGTYLNLCEERYSSSHAQVTDKHQPLLTPV